ncbi:MAG: molecular chaperone DnaJ [Candidatus Kaelpia aquatica]|nr:molecular chaperone DnaJ [Candidatus Kaelpia aquatica]
MKRDYYEILGLTKGVSKDEIKKTYRKLAMEHHPDRVSADKKAEAEERFKEISEAYAVLSDDEKKSQYDVYGHAGINSHYSQEDLFRNVDFSSVFSDLGFGGSIFENLFGGFGSSSHGNRSGGVKKGRDLEFKMSLTFQEAVKGADKELSFPSYAKCSKCSGSGSVSGNLEDCRQCGGAGRVSQQRGFFAVTTACPSCKGEGRIVKDPCPDCRGRGKINETKKLEVKIPSGVDNGSILRLSGKGEIGDKGGPAGDLYLHIAVKPHEIFRREGRDIGIELPITPSEAALGVEIQVPTIDGVVKMKIPAGTQSERVFRLRGKGVADPRIGVRGDELVKVLIDTPTGLNRKQRKLLESLNKEIPDDYYPQKKRFSQLVKNILVK